MAETRRAKVRALAKVNLDLRVLHRRPDRYHELRTIFQTISLGDRLEIAFTRSRTTRITLEEKVPIPGNLVVRAAERCLDAMRVNGRVEFRLEKLTPTGAGLGGGSSDAAAVLLALPALAGKFLSLERRLALASELGSDVPFFLFGGAAVGIGRGTELFPLEDAPAAKLLIVVPPVAVSTSDAYRDLAASREPDGLTPEALQLYIESFQCRAWGVDEIPAVNHFEAVVFRQHPSLGRIRRRLERLGARPARMSGSGSSLFGVFQTQQQLNRAQASFRQQYETVFGVSTVSRARYRSLWWRWLQTVAIKGVWPPQGGTAGRTMTS